MRRITIGIPESDLEKIEQMAEQKALGISEYIRMLVHIGLTIEEAVADGKSNSNDLISLQEQKFLWKTMLTWELEARYLLRHLIGNLIQGDVEHREELMEESKRQAEAHVNKLLNDLT